MMHRDAAGVMHAAVHDLRTIWPKRYRIPCTSEVITWHQTYRGPTITCITCTVWCIEQGITMEENVFWLKIVRWLVIGAVTITAISAVVGLQYCNAHDQRVVECVQTGRSPAECKEGIK